MIGIPPLAFLLSFCSLGYQLVLALALSDATGDFVLSQTLSLGVFLLGMGLGAFICGRSKREPWRDLLKVEWILAVAGFFAVSYLQMGETLLQFLGWRQQFGLFAMALPYALWLGYWTGFELPLLLGVKSGFKPGQVLAANYLGAFTATILVPIYLLPLLDLTGTVQVLGVLNFVAASLLLAPASVTAFRTAIHLSLGVAILGLVRLAPALSEVHLKTVYFSPRLTNEASFASSWNVLRALEAPIRLRSSYQWIDLLPPEFSSTVQGEQDFQIYMDRKLQVSAGSAQRYHESMVHGGINLLGRAPNRVLILGGGDGLLARELLTYAEIQHVDLVELDPAVIQMARTQNDLKILNAGALNAARVHVHTDDAFQFVRGAEKNYDLVLVDLPFPNSYDLSLLYTKEFYALVRRHLAEDGLLLVDFPLPADRGGPLPTLVHTLRAAGFERLFAFGTEDFFVAAASRPLAFDFETLVPKVSNQTLLNLISRASELEHAEREEGRVNSVLFPVHFGSLQ